METDEVIKRLNCIAKEVKKNGTPRITGIYVKGIGSIIPVVPRRKKPHV